MTAVATRPAEDRNGYDLKGARADNRLRAARGWSVWACLVAADAVSTLASLCLVRTLVANVPETPFALAIATVVALSFLAGAGLHAGTGLGAIERLRQRVLAVAAFSAVLVVGAGSLALANVLAFATLIATMTVAGYYAELAAVQLLRRHGLAPATALIVGSGPKAEALARMLASRPVLGIRPVAVLTPGTAGTPGSACAAGDTVADLPAITSLGALADPVDIAIAVGRRSLVALEGLAGTARHPISSTLLLADDAAEQSLWLSTRSLGVGVGIETDKASRLDRSRHIKRAMDVILAGAVAIPAGILTLIAALAVKVVDPGPAFYLQRRSGCGGRPFHILKVRTMYTDSDKRLKDHLDAHPKAREDWERRCKLVDDPRILPWIGPILRKTSIDELPQIWNVLRGDMSMVGPRPFPDYHIERFDDEFKAVRASVLPGLTGFWQISTRSDGDLETQKADDLFYIRNRSLWFDIYILLQTLPAVVTGTGAR